MLSLHYALILVTTECLCGCAWLLVWLCVTVPHAIVPYEVDTQEWSLHILFNNIDIDLKCYLHSGIMSD